MKEVIVKRNQDSFYKLVLSALVCATLFSSQLFVLGISVANGQSKGKNNKYEDRINKIKSLGAKYRTAMKTLDSLSGNPINSEEDVQKAVNTLDKLKPTLTEGSYSSLVSLVFADQEFKKSVEAEVDKVGANNLARMLKENPGMVMKFSNAENIQSNMKEQLANDAKTYKTLAERLKAVEEKFGDKTGVNNYSIPLSNSSSGHYRIAKVSFNYVSQYKNVSFLDSNSIQENNNLVSEAESAFWDGGISAAVVAGVTLLVAAYAAAKAEDFKEDNDGNSDFKICVDRANARLQNCLDDANSKKGFAKFVKKAGCWTRHGVDMNICVVLPQ